MAAKNTLDLGTFRPSKRRAGRPANAKAFLIAAACVLVAAIAVSAVLLAGNSRAAERIVDFCTAIKGVSIGGTDISGMTYEQAVEATKALEEGLLASVSVSLDVNGEKHEYTAADLGVETDYRDIMAQAMSYGHTGAFGERLEAAKAALSGGVNFDIKLAVSEDTLHSKLAQIKEQLDKAPLDAGFTFMKWGYSLGADGTATPYEPDIQKMIEDSADLKKLTYPDSLVRIKPEDMPPAVRYQFYKDTEYVDNFVLPDAAYISRFFYTPEQTGLIADTDAVYDELREQIAGDSFSTITVPVQVTEPGVRIDQVKQQTHLIASWTSSYGAGSHDKYDRVWNVAKMSGIICGTVLQPGVEWSINDTAGPRKTELGWKKASGIVDGGYVDQPGGGVCQISSTLYNAVIRCGLTSDNIVSKHHSIISGYIPMGLDATISTGSPDLKITNPYSTPLYVVSYMNPESKSVTVEVYGAPVIDPATGEEVIYDFDSEDMGPDGNPPVDIRYYDQTMLPDKITMIDPGTEKRYAEQQNGKKIQTYRHFKKPDGIEYNKEKFESVTIRPINGSIYCNFPDPSIPVVPVDPNAPVDPAAPAP
jgi:hypothetical protein